MKTKIEINKNISQLKDNNLNLARLHLNEELYRLIPPYTKLSEIELNSARNLLIQGAEPNFTNKLNGETLIERAFFNHDLKFLKLLTEFGGDSDCSSILNNIFEYLQENMPEKLIKPKLFNLKSGKLPIQSAIDDLQCQYFNPEYHEICNVLFSASEIAQTEYKRVADLSKELYQYLDLTIRNEWSNAQNEGKRLMVLIGEVHERNINPILIQSMIVSIFSKLTDHITTLTEQDDIIYECLDKTGRRLTRENMWGSSLSLHHLVKNVFKGTIIPIDQGHFGPERKPLFFRKDFDLKSESGVKYRNDIMSMEAIARSKGNVIAVVGADHLYGLIKETQLSTTFNVVKINATGISKEDESTKLRQVPYFNQCLKFTLSDEVIQACIISGNNKSLLTPDQAVQIGLNSLPTPSNVSTLHLK